MAKKNKAKSKHAPDVLNINPLTVLNGDDDDLMNDLLSQLDSRDQTVKEESTTALDEMQLEKQANELEAKPKRTAKDRFQARQARRTAALAPNIPSTDMKNQALFEMEAKDEKEGIDRLCQWHGRQLHQINPDGHCLYSAIADQLVVLGKLSHSQATHNTMRAVAANYMEAHIDDFLPFLPTTEDPFEGSGLMTPEQFREYCHSVRSTAVWGGEPEIQALTRALNIPIYVLQAGVPPILVHDPSDEVSADDMLSQDGVWISYHKKLYGLGEHYNSLRLAS